MEENLECIICYDEIDKKLGDYISDICDKCKYSVHITCYEQYILVNNRINKTDINSNICLMCHKSNIVYNTPLLDQRIIHNVPVQTNKICNNKFIGCGFMTFVLIIIIIYYILI